VKVVNALSAAEVPNFVEDDSRHLSMDEEQEYAKCKNDLIEI
jgi:hypothetical protein